MIHADGTDERIVLLCRDPTCRAVVEHVLRRIETHASAVEALLSVARRPARALLLNLADLQGAEQDVLAAIRRTRPGLPIYTLVRPEDEPLGRRLLGLGVSDYFLMPGDVNRLPRVLSPDYRPAPPRSRDGRASPARTPVEAAVPLETEAGRSASASCLMAACGLAELAMDEPHALFRKGAERILQAIGARHGCTFACDANNGRLDLVAMVGEAARGDPALLETDRASAERSARTGEVILVETGGNGGPAGGSLCLPIAEAGTTFGVICLSGKADGSRFSRQDRLAAEALAQGLAKLYRSALQRQHYARLALCDVETGLLNASAFRAYLETLIAQAENHGSQIAILLLKPQPGTHAADTELLGRLGRAVHTALPKGCQAGRVDPGLYGVIVSRPPDDVAAGLTADAFCEDLLESLASVAPRVAPSVRLRTSAAIFPRDGATGAGLMAAAEGRLASPA